MLLYKSGQWATLVRIAPKMWLQIHCSVLAFQMGMLGFLRRQMKMEKTSLEEEEDSKGMGEKTDNILL